MPDVSGALRLYARATDYVTVAGFENEISWQRNSNFTSITEPVLLREAAWVILCSGFRESLVRRIFDHISLCFCDWDSAAAIVHAYPACHLAAQASFRGTAKLSAIVETARQIEAVGFDALKMSILADPISTLRQFPYIGPITVWHLVKNLGSDVVKPDRHLMRVSKHFGFGGPTEFCAAIADMSGEPLKVVDLVVWRYLADRADLTLYA